MDKKLRQLENQSLPDLSKMDKHWDDMKNSLQPGDSLPKNKPNKRVFRWIVAASLAGIAFFITYQFVFKKKDTNITLQKTAPVLNSGSSTDTLPTIKFIPGKETSTVIGKDTITLRPNQEKATNQEFILKARTTDGKEVELKWTAVNGSGKKTFDTVGFKPLKEKPISKPILLKGKTTDGKEIEILATPVNDSTNKKPGVDNRKAIQDFFAQMNKQSQSFSINNKRDTVIQGQQGTALLIPANTFGANEVVTIIMKEYYSYQDIITNRLTTLSDDKQLVTGGMLHLTATVNGREVNIQPGKSIRWFIPDTSQDIKNMQLFNGFESNSVRQLSETPDTALVNYSNTINWSAQGQYFTNSSFTVEVRALDLRDYPYKVTYGKKTKAYYYLNSNSDLTKEQLHAILMAKNKWYDKIIIHKNKQKDWCTYKLFTYEVIDCFTSIGDTVTISPQIAKFHNLPVFDTVITPRQSISANTISNTLKNQLTKVAGFYSVEINKLGWINCDRFYNDNRPKVDFVVDLGDSASNYYTLLVFDKIKSMMNGYTLGNKVAFTRVPEGETAKIISVSIKDGKPVAAVQTVQLTKKVFEGLKFEETTALDFKEKARSLDKP